MNPFQHVILTLLENTHASLRHNTLEHVAKSGNLPFIAFDLKAYILVSNEMHKKLGHPNARLMLFF